MNKLVREQNITPLLNQLNELSEYFKSRDEQQERTAKTHAPSFSPFAFIKTNEMELSRLIAYFLNPHAEHGQRRLFLDHFLRQIQCEDYIKCDDVVIAVEHTLSHSARRHDIVIKGLRDNQAAWVISIENKLRGAGDQNNQIEDYINDLKTLHPENYLLLYLKPYLERPSVKSISSELWDEYELTNRAKSIDGELIHNWLASSVKEVRAKNVQLFIQQFKTYIKENIMGQVTKEEATALIKKITSDEALLSSTLKLANIQNELRCYLLDELAKQMKERLQQSSFYSKWTIEVSHSGSDWQRRYSGIYLKYQCSEFRVGFESQKDYFGDWIIGVCPSTPKAKSDEQMKQLFSRIGDYYSDTFKRSSQWPRYQYLDYPYSGDWSTNVDVWLEIRTGSFSEYLFELFERLISDLEEHHFLPAT